MLSYLAGVSQLPFFKQKWFSKRPVNRLAVGGLSEGVLETLHTLAWEAWRETMTKNELRICVYTINPNIQT